MKLKKEELLSKEKIVKSLFWVYLETISAQLVNFIVTVILARLLSPDDYGQIALVTVFINIANVFVTSGIGTSLVQKKDADEKDYNTMFWANFLISIVLYASLFGVAPYISMYYNSKVLGSVLRVLALRIPLSAFNSIQTSYISSKMIFRKSFFSTSLGAILSGIIGIVLAFADFGLWALVGQNISNVIFNTFFLMYIVDWKPRLEFSITRFKELFSFGWKILITSLMFTANTEIRSLIIGKRYSTSDLGFYNKGAQFPQMIASNIDVTINRVLFPTLTKKQNELSELALITRRSAKTSAYIMTPILFGLAIVGDNVVALLLTDKWLPCVLYLQLMCISWWMQPTQSCSIQAIKAIGRSDLYLRIEVISKLVGIGLLVGAVFVFNTPYAIAVSMVISQAFALVLYGIHVQIYVGYKFINQIKDICIPGFLGAVMSVVVYFVRDISNCRLLVLCIQIIIGALVYLLFSELIKPEAYIYLKQTLLRKVGKKQNDTIS